MSVDHSEFIANYDREIFGDFARSFYGDSGFYNIGYWADICPKIRPNMPNMAPACEALVHLMGATDSTNERDDCSMALDVGCGLGATTAIFSSLYANAAMHGINLSAVQLEAAQTRCPQAVFQVMDATELTFPDASFDRIFCVEALFYFQNRAKFLSEARRVLHPGGRLIVTDALYRRRFGLQLPACNLGSDPDTYQKLAQEVNLNLVVDRDITTDSLEPYNEMVQRLGYNGWARLVRSAITSYHLLVFERP